MGEPQPRSLPPAEISQPETSAGIRWRPRITRRGVRFTSTLAAASLTLLACAGPGAKPTELEMPCDTGTVVTGRTFDLAPDTEKVLVDVNWGDTIAVITSAGANTPVIEPGSFTSGRTEAAGGPGPSPATIIVLRNDADVSGIGGNIENTVSCVLKADADATEAAATAKYPGAKVIRVG